MAKLTETEKR